MASSLTDSVVVGASGRFVKIRARQPRSTFCGHASDAQPQAPAQLQPMFVQHKSGIALFRHQGLNVHDFRSSTARNVEGSCSHRQKQHPRLRKPKFQSSVLRSSPRRIQFSGSTCSGSKPYVTSKLSPSTVDIDRVSVSDLKAADDDSIPHTIPSFIVDGYSEWHTTPHIPEPISEPLETCRQTGHSKEVEDEELTTSEVRLLSVPVLSKEEQLELAATPAHPLALTALYWSHCLNCLGEHAWRFLSPAVLSLLHGSLLPVACASFVGQLVIFLGAPWVGQFMDNTPRVTAFNTLCIVQTAAMLLSALATGYGLSHPPVASLSGLALVRQPWFLAVMAAGAVDKLTGLASGVAFERDWVILLAGQNRPIALASANAILRRVDLFCELAGPMSFGWLLSSFSPHFCLNTAMVLTLVSLPALLVLVHVTDRLSSGALRRPRHSALHHDTPTSRPNKDAVKSQTTARQGQAATAEHQTSSSLQPAVPVGGGPLGAAVQGWRSFLGQSVLPASLAYVLLYFNAVLSPGGLMTSFLTQRGVDVSVIGVFRGACAAMGFAATFVSAPLVARLGVLQAGASALVFQSVLLASSVAVFYFSKANQKGLLMVFLALVVLSRLGLWLYDVIDAQIFQTAVPSSEANLVGTTEIALASLAELLMLGVAIVLHDASRFGQLALLSMGAVLAATAIYCAWLAKPDERRSAMFPKRPEWTYGRNEGDETPVLLGGSGDLSTAPVTA